jgi:CheY-like chemotaxis protein
MVLELKGHVVHAVHEPEAALEAAAVFGPQIVLLDIGLPRMDGCEVARRIRAMPGGQNIVLLAVTGWGQEADRQRAHDAGFDSYLTKPLDAAVLSELIDSRASAGSATMGD